MNPPSSSPTPLGRSPEGPEGPRRGLGNKDPVALITFPRKPGKVPEGRMGVPRNQRGVGLVDSQGCSPVAARSFDGPPSGASRHLPPQAEQGTNFRPLRSFVRAFAFLLLSAALLITAATAREGHDHGDSGPAVTGTRSPRFEAKSDLFELVGILDKTTLRLFLDRYTSNEPVTDATIDIEVGTSKTTAAKQADGTYLFDADILRRPGSVAFTFTVTAGSDVDLLAANLVIPDPHHDHPVGPGRFAALWPGIAVGAGVSAVAALIAIGTALLWRRRGVRR